MSLNLKGTELYSELSVMNSIQLEPVSPKKSHHQLNTNKCNAILNYFSKNDCPDQKQDNKVRGGCGERESLYPRPQNDHSHYRK